MTISNAKALPVINAKKAFATISVAALLALPAFAIPASAADTAPDGGTIEAFTGTNLVDLQGYPAGEAVTIEVLRKGVMIGSVSGTTDGDGFIEFNHVGGGPASEGGDCFEPNATPDISPGDVIRTKNAGGIVNGSATVRNLDVDFDTIKTNTTNNTITISGHARGTQNAPIARGDILELRLNAAGFTWDVTKDPEDPADEGRRDLRVDIGRNLDAKDNFTRVLRVSHKDAVNWKRSGGEVALEWSVGGGEAASPPAIFVSDDAGGEAIVGCPRLTEYGINRSSVRAINKTFVAGDAPLTLSGRSFNASAVKVTLNDGSAATAPVAINGKLSQASGHQSWTASIRNTKVGSLRDGMLTARATYTVNKDVSGNNVAPATFNGKNLKILKDTVVPTRTPEANPRPGVYARSQSVSLSASKGLKIHYTVNGSRPNANSKVFVRPIRVTGTQTIRAVSVDKAGNVGPIGGYRYVIR